MFLFMKQLDTTKDKKCHQPQIVDVNAKITVANAHEIRIVKKHPDARFFSIIVSMNFTISLHKLYHNLGM